MKLVGLSVVCCLLSVGSLVGVRKKLGACRLFTQVRKSGGLRRWQFRSKMASLLFASFANLTQLLFVQPPPLDGEYDGLEYTWKFFVFRPARKSSIYSSLHRARSLLLLNYK